MIRGMIITMAVSAAILKVPDWHPPYTYWENFVLLMSTIGVLGPPFLILLLIFNRLVNRSFRFKD